MSLFAYCKECQDLFIGVGGRKLLHCCPAKEGAKVLLRTKAAVTVRAMPYMEPHDAAKLSGDLALQAVYSAERGR